MDPAQGETQGKSITSKLKAKVKGVKGKVHLPGHKKRHGDDNQANDGDSSDYSSDDSPKKPGPETGYNLGASTPFTTVKTTPLSPTRENTTSDKSHTRDDVSRPSHTTSGYDALHPSSAPPTGAAPMVSESPRSMAPTLDEKFQYGDVDTTSRPEGYTPKMGYMGDSLANPASPSKPREGVLGSIKDTVGGAAAVVGSKMGYYTEVDQTPVVPTPRDPNAPSVIDKAKHSLGLDKPSDPFAPTLMEKTKATLGLDKPSDPYAPSMLDKAKATLGLDKPSDPYAPSMLDKTKATLGSDKPSDPYAPTLMEKTKATMGLDKPSDPYAPTLMEKTKATMGLDKPSDPYAPTLMEKTKATMGLDKPSDPYAPSMLDKTKATLGLDKPSDPNAPTLVEKTKATLGLGPSSPNTVTSPAAGTQPGVVDRVTGAMSSLFTGAPKGQTGEAVQDTFPAQSDYVPPAATVPHQSYTVRSGDETMATRLPGAYNSSANTRY